MSGEQPLRGRVAAVTGASSGIGREAAVALARAGAHVVGLGRDAEGLADVAGRTGGEAVVADLADPAQRDIVIGRVLDIAGRLDILVNNAGVGLAGGLSGTDPERLAALVAVNLTAPLVLASAALAPLTASAGCLVNVASIVGFTGNPSESAYSATKAGLIGFTRSLRQEVRGTGVRVSLIVPGVVDTAFFDHRGSPYTRRWPRPLLPERVAAAIVHAATGGPEEIFVPAWMRFPALLATALPGLYGRLAARFG